MPVMLSVALICWQSCKKEIIYEKETVTVEIHDTVKVVVHDTVLVDNPVVDNPLLYTSCKEITLNGDERECSFIVVSSNTPWEAKTDVPWIGIKSVGGPAGTSSLLFTISQNDGPERTGMIGIVTQARTEVIAIKQNTHFYLDVDKTHFDLDVMGGEYSAAVSTNLSGYEASVTRGSEWLSLAPSSSSLICFSAATNNSFSERRGEILLSDTRSGLKKTITVSQSHGEAILLQQKTLEIGKEGGSVSFDVQSTMDVALDIPEDCSWIKEVRTKALSSSTFELLVEANDAERREGKVSVVNRETGWSDTITVKQGGMQYRNMIQTTIFHYMTMGNGNGGFGNEFKDVKNPEATLVEGSDWITLSVTDAGYSGSFSRNEGESRIAVIRFYEPSTGDFDEVIIYMPGVYPSILPQNYISFDSGAKKDHQLRLIENCDIRVVTGKDQLIDYHQKGGSLFVSVKENKYSEHRYIVFEVTDRTSGHRDYLTIGQSPGAIVQ